MMSDEILNNTAEETPVENTVEETAAEAETTTAAAPAAETAAETTETAAEPAAEAAAEAPAEPVQAVKKAAKPAAEITAPTEKTVDVLHFSGAAAKEGRTRRKVRQGRVDSNKMQKTVVVVVETRVRHPLYGKFMRRSARFKAHDENNECGIGDLVEIMETRPLSKEKTWRVVRIIEKAR